MYEYNQTHLLLIWEALDEKAKQLLALAAKARQAKQLTYAEELTERYRTADAIAQHFRGHHSAHLFIVE